MADLPPVIHDPGDTATLISNTVDTFVALGVALVFIIWGLIVGALISSVHLAGRYVSVFDLLSFSSDILNLRLHAIPLDLEGNFPYLTFLVRLSVAYYVLLPVAFVKICLQLYLRLCYAGIAHLAASPAARHLDEESTAAATDDDDEAPVVYHTFDEILEGLKPDGVWRWNPKIFTPAIQLSINPEPVYDARRLQNSAGAGRQQRQPSRLQELIARRGRGQVLRRRDGFEPLLSAVAAPGIGNATAARISQSGPPSYETIFPRGTTPPRVWRRVPAVGQFGPNIERGSE